MPTTRNSRKRSRTEKKRQSRDRTVKRERAALRRKLAKVDASLIVAPE